MVNSNPNNSFKIVQSDARSIGGIGGFFGGGKVKNRLKLTGVDSKVLLVAAENLDQKEGMGNIESLKKQDSLGFFQRHVTVKVGNEYFDINVRSCAKRFGITNEEVFELAKTGNFSNFAQTVQRERSAIQNKLAQEEIAASDLKELADEIYLMRGELTSAICDTNKEPIKQSIPSPNLFYNYNLKTDGTKIVIEKNILGSKILEVKEIDITNCFSTKSQIAINRVKLSTNDCEMTRVLRGKIMKTLEDNQVSKSFNETDLKAIQDYINKYATRLIFMAQQNQNGTYYLRPTQSSLKRALQINADGTIFLHFNRCSKTGEDRLIGKGSFKKAKFVINLTDGKLLVVAKTKIEGETKEQRSSNVALIEREAGFLSELAGKEHIAQEVGFVVVDGKRGEKSLSLQPYYNKGDLGNSILGLDQKTKYSLGAQMLQAVATLEEKGIVHRDIKPENFFLSEGEQKTKTIYLGDFGLAVRKTELDEKMKCVGTPKYVSPEYFKASSSPDTVSALTTSKLDSWALGVTLYRLFTNKEPSWIEGDIRKIFTNTVNLRQKDIDNLPLRGLDINVANLIKGLLAVDPNQRISPIQALATYGPILQRLFQ